MDKNDILVRTAKGNEEIAKKTFQLPLKHRSLLIMIDDKTSEAALLRKTATLGDIQKLVQDLEQQGFLERRAVAAAAPVSKGAAPGALNTALKQFMIDQMYEALGPESDSIVIRIERCRNNEDLLQIAAHCRDTLAGIGKTGRSDAFWKKTMTFISA